MAPFKDWIPAQDPVGAQGSGFKDFVPDPTPEPKKEEKPEPTVIKEQPKKKSR